MASATPPSPPAGARPPWTVGVWAGAIALGSLWAYRTSFQGAFVFDDLPTIVENPAIRHLWPWAAAADGGPTLTVGGRPVPNFTLALNYAVSGTAIWSYHAVNLLIHVLAALALFGIVRRTLVRMKVAADAIWLAGTAALIWAVHPLLTEAVTYVVQRTESLMGLFYLLTLYCFIRGAEEGGEVSARSSFVPQGGTTADEKAGGSRWYWLSILCCLFGMGCKEVMATAPVAVLLYDRTFLAGTFRSAWTRRRAFYLGLAATWLPLAFLVAATGGTRGGTAGFGVGLTPWVYGLTQVEAVAHYLRLALWPHPLVFDYGTFVVTHPLDVIWPGLGLLLLLAATAAALVRRSPWGFVGAWFFLTLAPSSSIVPVATQTMAEHGMYLALAAVVLGLVFGLRALLGRWAWPAGALLALVLAFLTQQRNEAYASLLTLWRDTVSAHPSSDRAHHNYALALRHERRIPEAIAEFRAALRVNPAYAEAHDALGEMLSHHGHADEGIEELRTALRLQPRLAEAHNNLGRVLCETGRSAEGIPQYEAALRINPRLLPARHNLASALLTSGRVAEAIEQSRAMLRFDPDSAVAHCDLGNELMHAGRTTEGLAELSLALRLKPDFAEAHNNLGGALVTVPGRTEEGIAHFEEALRLDPDLADGHYNLGLILARTGRMAAGMPHLLEALRLKPGFPQAHSNLGIILAQSGRMPEAAGHFAEAVRLDPADPGMRKNLVRALVELGRMPEALVQFEQLVRLVPDDPELRQAFSEMLRGAGRNAQAQTEAAVAADLRRRRTPIRP